MDTIKEVTRVIKKSSVHVELEQILGGKNSKTYQLFELIQEGIDESEIRLLLYPGGSTSKSAYYKLKSRLESKLVNGLFLIDLKSTSFDKANLYFYQINKLYAAARILWQRRARSSANRILDYVVSKSMEYEFYGHAMLASRDLRMYYRTIGRDPLKGQYYSVILKKAEKYNNQEMTAEELMQDLNIWYVSKDFNKYRNISEEYEKKFDQLRSYNNNKTTFNKHLFGAMIYHYELLGDYWKVKDIAEEGIVFFKKSKRAGAPLTNMYNRKSIAELNLRQYEDCISTMQVALNISVPHSVGWHMNHLTLFFAYTHLQKYDKLTSIFYRGTNKNALEFTQQQVIEFWRICEAYMRLLEATKKIDTLEKSSFKVGRFLNNVPMHSAHKRGFNVAILLVHVLFMIQRKEYDKVINRVESLKLYSYRYMKKFKKLRTHYMIMMIEAVVKGDFRKIRVEAYAKNYVKKLKATPVDMSDMQSTLEVMPYEHMWELILEMLD